MTIRNPQAAIADAAESLLGIREDRGRNQSSDPRLKEIWKYTNYPKGYGERQPWCAALVAASVAIADARTKDLYFPQPPKSAAVAQWIPWAKQNGAVVFGWENKKYKPQRGDIMVFLPKLSHIGVVTKLLSGDRVQLVEGNTSSGDTGSQRDGGGSYRKIRSRSAWPDAKFIRLPARATRASND